MNGRTHRIVVLFGLAVACAVALAGGAQAATRPDDRGGSIGVGATRADVDLRAALARAELRNAASAPMPDVFERAVVRESRNLVRPDDRAGVPAPAALRSRRRSPRQSRTPVAGAMRSSARPPCLASSCWRRGRNHAVPAAPPDPALSSSTAEYANAALLAPRSPPNRLLLQIAGCRGWRLHSLCGQSSKRRPPRTVHRTNCVRCSYDAGAAGFSAHRRRRRSASSADVAVRSRSGAAYVDGCGAHLAGVVAYRAGRHRRGARCGPVRPATAR